MAEQASEGPSYRGSAFFSYGFRPFFLGAALFAGVAVPLWILLLAEVGHSNFLYPARDWHVHEMVFGFLPAVITGFMLTAIPNWTDRPPIRGYELMLLLSFSRYDGLSIALVEFAVLSWVVQPSSMVTGWLFALAGLVNLGRLGRWYGWATWRELLVLILHFGYGWFALSLLILGGSILGIGLLKEDAVHAFTSGAVGVMTLAVMTRASLGHTGRPRHAGPLTVLIYMLVNLGAALRVFGPMTDLPANLVLAVAAGSWSGAYLLFALVYGPFILRSSLDE
jgi:uncharacterized protein involved in response to NO